MTKDELLKERYKVIADYPGSTLTVGEILYEGKDKRFGTWEDYGFNEISVKEYPHLFQRLEWWQDRKEEDMPEYVKHTHTKKVSKAEWWKLNNLWFSSPSESPFNSVIHLTPATEEEYNNQQTKQSLIKD